MKYFTPEMYVRLHDREPEAMDAADEAWADAVARYDSYVESILPQLPPAVRQLLACYHLHDAEVLSAGRQGDTFVLQVRLDTPPNDLLSITYTLAAEPVINRSAFPPEYRSPHMTWQYEELEVCGSGDARHYRQAILFSNGWEIQIPFRDVRLTTVQPIYPCPQQAIVTTASNVSPAS